MTIAELAEALLCDALGYSRLLHAHRQEETAGDCRWEHQEDGHTQNQQAIGQDMVRCAGCGLPLLADGGYRPSRPKAELYSHRGCYGLDWSRPSEEYAASDGRSRTADRQPDKPALLQCLHESLRPVRQARTEMQVLRTVRGRWNHRQSRQGVAAVTGSSNPEFPQVGAGLRPSHGQAADNGGTQGRGVLGSVHQAVQDLRIKKDFGARGEEAAVARFQQASEDSPFCEQLPWYLPAYGLVQHQAQAVHEDGISENRCVQCRHDKDNGQTFILQIL